MARHRLYTSVGGVPVKHITLQRSASEKICIVKRQGRQHGFTGIQNVKMHLAAMGVLTEGLP
jgi:hypothetical protein